MDDIECLDVVRSSSTLQKAEQDGIPRQAQIQSYGALLVFNDLRRPPIAYSANMACFFEGSAAQARLELKHYTLNSLFDTATVGRLHKALVQSENEGRPSSLIIEPSFGIKNSLQCVCHRRKTNIFFEFFVHGSRQTADQYLQESQVSFEVFLLGLMSRAKVLQHGKFNDSEIGDLGSFFIEAIQRLTGFDRVALYRFSSDWSADVIAEAVSSHGIERFMGLHVHEKDIPLQIRALYQVMPFRYIADITNTMVPLVSAQIRKRDGQQANTGYLEHLDMRFCHLASDDANYLQFLASFKVRAAANFAVTVNGQLWGIVDCHHFSSDPVMFETLVRTDIVIQQLAAAIEARMHGDLIRIGHQVSGVHRRLAAGLTDDLTTYELIERSGEDFLHFCEATGFAICSDQPLVTIGRTPSAQFLSELLPWLNARMTDGVYCTDHLVSAFPHATVDTDIAAGILALGQLHNARARPDVKLIWFRPQVVRHISWLRSPHVDEQLGGGDLSKLAIQQTQLGRSNRWQEREIATVRALYDALAHTMISQLSELQLRNARLQDNIEAIEKFGLLLVKQLLQHLQALGETMNALDELLHSGQATAQAIIQLERSRLASTKVSNRLIDFIAYLEAFDAELEITFMQLPEEMDYMVQFHQLTRAITIEYARLPLPQFCGQRQLIQFMIFTATMNAIEHHHEPAQCRMLVSLEDAGDHWVFSFEDNGPGVEPCERAFVLQPYACLERGDAIEAIGSGLPLLHYMVRRVGGSLELGESSLLTVRSSSPLERAQQPPQRGLLVRVSLLKTKA